MTNGGSDWEASRVAQVHRSSWTRTAPRHRSSRDSTKGRPMTVSITSYVARRLRASAVADLSPQVSPICKPLCWT